jgi:hypothetical protein
MIFFNSYTHLFILGGLIFLCTGVCADPCYEQYRLLDNCTDKYPPFIVSPPPTTAPMDQSLSHIGDEQQTLGPEAGLLSGLSLSPQGGGREFVAAGTGSVQTVFGASFSSPTISFRNSEVYRARGLFDLKVSQGYQGG